MTDENIAAILRTVALGVWPDRAAQIHGVSAEAMRVHKHRNHDFVTAIEKAEATAEASYLGKILRHTEKQWTAAAWMLERRWPDRWAQRQKVEHSGNAESPVRIEATATKQTTADIAEQMRAATALIDEVLAQRDKKK